MDWSFVLMMMLLLLLLLLFAFAYLTPDDPPNYKTKPSLTQPAISFPFDLSISPGHEQA